MNTTTKTPRQQNNHRQRYTPQFGGNSITESESPLTRLLHTYMEAGLGFSDACDAALADFAHGFNAA